MKNYVPCPWSDNLANSTAISFVLLIGILITVIVILVLFYHRIPKEWLYWVLIPMIVVIGGSSVSCVAFAPRGVSVDDKEIILYRYMGKVTIPRSEITDIQPYPTKGTIPSLQTPHRHHFRRSFGIILFFKKIPPFICIFQIFFVPLHSISNKNRSSLWYYILCI